MSAIVDLDAAEGTFFFAQAVVGLNAVGAEAVQTLHVNDWLLHQALADGALQQGLEGFGEVGGQLVGQREGCDGAVFLQVLEEGVVEFGGVWGGR